MDHRPASLPNDRRRRWHALAEQYTPDGALGRLLLAAVTGSVASFGLFLTLALLLSPPGPFAFLVGLLAGGATLLVTLLTAALLWPVYLSLIGNVESASEYRVGSGSPAGIDPGRATSLSGPTAESDDDALELLKRRYAAGELSEEAFERRLDDLLEADEAVRTKDVESGGRVRDATPEPERE